MISIGSSGFARMMLSTRNNTSAASAADDTTAFFNLYDSTIPFLSYQQQYHDSNLTQK